MDVAVLGAGDPGRDLALVCTTAGHAVRLYDDDANAAMDGLDAVEGRLRDGVAADRLEATTGLEAAVRNADVVVETATADVGAVQERLAAVEDTADREALLAVATVVPVTAAASGLRHPDRAVGLRYRELADVPLVEVVVADQTSAETRRRARSVVTDLDRSPVVVRDGPGGVSTRLELALEAEAMRLVADGVAAVAAADEALRLGYGYPAGPLERADRAGLDGRLATLERLADRLGDRFAPPPLLRERVDEGHLGRATGEGFYVWADGEPSEPALPDPVTEAASDRPEGSRG